MAERAWTGRTCNWRRRDQGDECATCPRSSERLETAVTAAGGTVHWARDAAEANAIVASIVHGHGATEVVKVKSMATPVELNEALRLDEIDVWETDLAETIVTLGHDLPSHILVPAIHKNRTEIRDIAIDEMGRVGRPAPAGLTDAPRLAEAARLHLREKFSGRRSRSPARISRSPRPGPSSSSSPRATAGCA